MNYHLLRSAERRIALNCCFAILGSAGGAGILKGVENPSPATRRTNSQLQRENSMEIGLRERCELDSSPSLAPFPRSKVFFVGADGHDPPDSLIAKFRGENYSVRKWSRLKPINTKKIKNFTDSEKDYVDKITGEQGMPVTITVRVSL